MGNGQSIPINHIGNGQLSTKLYNFRLKNLLHSSRISSNLLSVHKLCKDNNCSCYFDSSKFLIQDLPSGKVLYKGLSKNGLYPIHTFPSSPSMSPSATASASFTSHMIVLSPQLRYLVPLSHMMVPYITYNGT